MPRNFEVRIDSKELEAKLVDVQKQIRFATARILTRTAQHAVLDLQGAMKEAFDRPTPWTLRAFYAKPARTTDLQASVESREFAGKGRPASKYLTPEILGGNRAMKGFEKALSAISGGQYVLPGKGAQLDAFGNINRGQLVQILSRLSLLNDGTANLSTKTTTRLGKKGLLTAASGMRSEYFVARDKGTHRALGIYKLLGPGKVVPVLIFTQKQPHYSIRLPFGGIVDNSVSKNWERIADEEVANAIATARLR